MNASGSPHILYAEALALGDNIPQSILQSGTPIFAYLVFFYINDAQNQLLGFLSQVL